jgi:1-acyl-sn-glycerol-3-phosphate acyltransferase
VTDLGAVAPNVVRLPRGIGGTLSAPVRVLLPKRSVDDWGRDPAFVCGVHRLARLRWQVTVEGEEHLPRRSGALLVASSRRFSLSALFAALSIAEATGRPVRFVGRPDSSPVGDAMRRLGALLARPDEIAGALRHGELVLIATRPTGSSRHAGTIDYALVAPAVLTGSSIIPVAALSSSSTRAARVKIGPPVRPTARRRGPLAEVELADATQRSLQRLLDSVGLMRSRNPLAMMLARN